MNKLLIILIIALVFSTCGELEIADYTNSLTNDQTTFLEADPYEEITIIVNPNTQVDEWIWSIDGIQQNESSNKFSTRLNNTENRTISVYGTNELQNTTPMTWYIMPKDSPTSFYSDSSSRTLTFFTFLSIIGLIILAAKLKLKQE